MDATIRRRRGRPRIDPATGGDATATVQSIDRAVALLGLVAAGNGVSLTEAAAALELAPSTAHRLLATLHRHGLVEFEPEPQLWHVGVEAFRLGAGFLRRRNLVERARAPMQELVERCGETVNLALGEADGVVFVSQVETHAAIRAFFRAGTRAALHASGAGKAILAVRRAAPPTAGLDRFTPATLVDPAALRADLAATRARGFAIDDEERHPGMRCVAAAICNEHGEPIAGLSISGPSVRMDAAAIARFGPLVAQAAAAVTRSIAGVGPG